MADEAIRLEAVTKSLGSQPVLRDVSIAVQAGRACCILGRSGTGKSVTLKHIIGLIRPDSGRIFVGGEEITGLDARGLARVRRGMGFLFQNAALFDSITVGENVAFPLRRHTRLPDREIRQRVREKLADVGLEHAEDRMPSDLSGGMRKRAGLARAMALDPDLLFFDEPSAGLDPISSRLLDELILELQASLGSTAVVVTHELASIFAIGSNSVYLDVETRTAIAHGNPRELRGSHPDPKVRRFLNRGKEEKAEQPEKTAKVEKNGHVEKK
jgi:phospholipid/cholesterol/gamma-HCH transport system ATP-binding protein